jgi:hypothetical protein
MTQLSWRSCGRCRGIRYVAFGGGLVLKTQALLVERHIFLEATSVVRLSDWLHRKLTNVAPPRLSLSLPIGTQVLAFD